MQRLILQDLINWKNKPNRKPLILKGVRQTGKTYVLKEFGRSHFSAVHYINFENNPKAGAIFKTGFDPSKILTDLSFIVEQPIDIKNDLLIFDEIQECPPALTSLKYFAEDLPELAVCCAGSLLGLHLSETSFPVGKVDFFHMRPMCFAEFLNAAGESQLLQVLNQCSNNSISEVVHERLWQKLKIYFITGGLPEVVKTYIENQNNLYQALTAVRENQQEIIYGYYSDIAKHSGKVNAMHIDRVWKAIPSQLAKSQDGSAKSFQFKGIIPGIDRYQRLANVIDWLIAAELIIKTDIVEHVELPLMAYTKNNNFKLYLFDIGILGALSDLPPKAILDYDYGTYKGYFAESFVAQEFLAKGVRQLYSWQANRAEVEFLYIAGTDIIPVEVKSGWVLRNQSLNKYTEKYKPLYSAVFSANNLQISSSNKRYHYPLYMAYWFAIN